jgi:hypothetical protein
MAWEEGIMSRRENRELTDSELDAMLAETFGPPPVADAVTWRERHPSAVAWLDPRRIRIATTRRQRMQRYMILAATAAAAICAWLGIGGVNFPVADHGSAAFGQIVAQIQKARTLTFRVTFDRYVTGPNGKERKETITIDRAIREPGLWRSIQLDKDGQVVDGQIRDYIHGRELMWQPKEKKASLRDVKPDPDFSGMTAWLKEKLAATDWEWIGTRKTATGEVNVLRHTFQEIREDPFHGEEPKSQSSSYDVWIDPQTKKLVRFQIPGADIYDFDHPPARDALPRRLGNAALAVIYSDFVFDAELDDALFRFEPPEGYAVASSSCPEVTEVTEKDIIEYLGLLAECRQRSFPDQVSKYPFFPIDWINALINKKDPTAVEERFLTLKKRYSFYPVDSQPFTCFADRYAQPGSFRYLGKGVTLGERDRIVCWYRLKDAKNPGTYRVVYGDLSVKNVDAKDLPLPVDP